MVLIERRRPDVGNVTWEHLRLPPFPQVAVRVLQLANKENVQMHQLSELISSDPAFASEVLTIANSLLYAPRFPSKSIQQAIVVLGIHNLQGMCLTVGRQNLHGQGAASAFHAGNLAAQPGLRADRGATGVRGIPGQGHGVYGWGAARHWPAGAGRGASQGVRRAAGTHKGSSASILQAERELFGTDHCEIGGG